MKFSVFTVMLPEWDPATTVRKLKKYGYDGVEWRVTNTRPDAKSEEPSYWGNNLCTVELDTILEKAAEIRDMTVEAGLETAALAGYHGIDDYESTEKMLEAAAIMGAPLIRAGVPLYDGTVKYDELLAKAREDYEKMSGAALKAGVKICVETHMNQIAPSASAARRLLDGLDPNAVGVIYDPGNMVTEGHERTEMGLDILGPYLAHVHAKNGAWVRKADAGPGEHPWSAGHASAMDDGIVNWSAVLAALKDFGYDGYVSFEDFSSGRDTDEKVRFNVDYLKSLM
ncbi:MAG: sugar phosphate isomerase/epimerase family protein [Planctomycetota bacterium]|jgi:sugar phosphate isomerase/epimerase